MTMLIWKLTLIAHAWSVLTQRDVMVWGSETEMYAFAHMIRCNIYSYNPTDEYWMEVVPHVLDSSLPFDVCQKSMWKSF